MNKIFTFCLLIILNSNLKAQFLSPEMLQNKGILWSKNFDLNIPFIEKKGGWVILKLKINGIERRFIFDTGSGINVIDPSALAGLGLTKIGFTKASDSSGKERYNDVYGSDNLKIDSLTFSDVAFLASSLPDIIACEGIDGILGNTIISKLNWVIDYDTQKIRLTDTKIEKGEGKEVYFYLENNVHRVTLELGDNSFEHCTLDFGCAAAIMFPKNILSSKVIETKLKEGLYYESVSASFGLYGKTKSDTSQNLIIPKFKLREITLDSTNVLIEKNVGHILVGVSVFSKYKIAIDNVNRRYIFYSRKNTGNFISTKRRPISVSWENKKLVIDQVKLCSSVSLNDVQIEAEVKSLNGKTAKNFKSYCEFDQWLDTQNEKDWDIILMKNKKRLKIKKEEMKMIKDCR